MDAEDVVIAMLGRLGSPRWIGDPRSKGKLLPSPERADGEPVPASLMDFLAVRLTLTAVASASVSKAAGAGGNANKRGVPAAKDTSLERLAEATHRIDVDPR